MADAAVDYSPTDHFDLSSLNLVVQSGKKKGPYNAVTRERSSADGKEIDEIAQFDEMTDYSNVYHYSGSNFVSDFTKLLAEVVNSIKTTKFSIKLVNQDFMEITIEGHQHTTNAHAQSATIGEFAGYALALADLIGTAQGSKGINDGDKPFANADADSALVGLTIDFSCNHQDDAGTSGEHHSGNDSMGRVTVQAEYTGTPSLTTTGWTVTDPSEDEAVEKADTYTISAFRKLSKSLVA